MSNNKKGLNKAEPTGRTIARENARLITAKGAKVVVGRLINWPWDGATSSQCVWYKGADYGGRDE